VFLCGKRSRNEEALRLFDRAIAIPLSRKAANRAMLNTNAGTCAKYTDPARAEEYLRRALAEDPRFPDALLQMGEVSLERGKALQARGFVERYLDVAKASPAILWLGVRVERALGDNAAGRRYGDRLVKEFPEAGETRQFLAQPERRG
jgi:type IV pilus assembly protein PilF